MPNHPNYYLQNKHQAFNLFLIFLVFTIPVLLTNSKDSLFINSITIPIQLLFIAANLKHLIQSSRVIFKKHTPYVFLITLVFASGFPGIRNEIYFVNFMFFLTLASSLTNFSSENYVRSILKLKTIILASACLFIALYFIFTDFPTFQEALSLGKLPAYNNIRHLNYELAVTLPLAAYLFTTEENSTSNKLAWLSCLLIFSYFSLSTAGRGQALSLTITASAIALFLYSRKDSKKIITSFIVIFIGFSLVFATQQHDYFMNRLIGGSDLQLGANHISSGRVEIWIKILSAFFEQTSIELIMGSHRDPVFYMRNAGIDIYLHPHNSLIQALLEYGYVGLFTILFLFYKVTSQCLKTCRSAKQLNNNTISATILLGLIFYSLVDGVFYHALPLTMSTILCAILFSNAFSLPQNQ